MSTKRGRKAKITTVSQTQKKSTLKVYSASSSKKKQSQDSEPDDVIILRLKVDINNLNNSNNGPMPYSSSGYEYEHFTENMMKSHPNSDTSLYKQPSLTSDQMSATSINIANDLNSFEPNVMNQIVDSMVEYSEAKKHKKWPKQVNIACYWCSEYFDTIPVGIPVKVEVQKIGVGKKQHLKRIYSCEDNYCTFECAVADLFKHKRGNFRERYSLLCFLYKEAHNLPKVKKIKSALPKKALARYGGPHSIDKFRQISQIDEVTYSVIDPPMIPVLSQLEINHMDFTVANRENSYIPIRKQLSANLVTNPIRQFQPQISATGIHNNNTLLRYMKE